jgi:hypothetical protein
VDALYTIRFFHYLRDSGFCLDPEKGNLHFLRKALKPFDIMYYSDEEWEEGNSLIINAAKEEGEVIYG